MHFKIALFPFWLTSATTDSVLTLARVLNLVGARPKYPFLGNFVFVVGFRICGEYLYFWLIFVFVVDFCICGGLLYLCQLPPLSVCLNLSSGVSAKPQDPTLLALLGETGNKFVWFERDQSGLR